MSLAAFIGWKGLGNAKSDERIDVLDILDLVPDVPGSKTKGVPLALLAMLG